MAVAMAAVAIMFTSSGRGSTVQLSLSPPTFAMPPPEVLTIAMLEGRGRGNKSALGVCQSKEGKASEGNGLSHSTTQQEKIALDPDMPKLAATWMPTLQ